MMRVSRFGLSHKSASIMYLKLSRSLVKPGYTVIPPSDSRLKLTMSPCFNPTSSQRLGGRGRIETGGHCKLQARIRRWNHGISWFDEGTVELQLHYLR